MSSIPRILTSEKFDLAISICGYETRARFLTEGCGVSARSHLILDYESDGHLSYDLNKNFFKSLPSVEWMSISEGNLVDKLKNHIDAILSRGEFENGDRSILFDISSCSRRVMANVFTVLMSGFYFNIQVYVVYSLAEFYLPPSEELPSHISEPVIGSLAGWSEDLAKSPCAVIGLGFEPGRALGCLDYLEIPEVRLFIPEGPDARFKVEVEKANKVLIEEAGSSVVFNYDVMDPQGAFEKMESLVSGLLRSYRPVIIPLGPKIFSAISVYLAIKLSPNICVWRTSSSPLDPEHDVFASGEVAVFSFSALRAARPLRN